jgi:hypothetical protein
MYNLEPGSLVAPDSCGVSDVSSLPFPFGIFDDNVTRLKDLDRECVRAVLSNGLEEPRNERGAHDLELERLRISDFDDCLAVVNVVEPFKVLLMRTLQMRDQRRSAKNVRWTH